MITIGIKALNEEKNIAAAIESALNAVRPFAGVVVLADSGSTDRTVEIASNYPIKIVQLSDRTQRCCGAGAQLAFQYSSGDYFYLLDGYMTLDESFLAVGIKFLEENSDVAAVGGYVREKNLQGQDFVIRASKVKREQHKPPRYVDRLDCGGLYRVTAINAVGYFTDRNLHSFEEFELGARLSAAAWKLVRISAPAVEHYGHTIGGYKLLWHRFRSGYSGGAGEVLRSALGKSHFLIVIRRLTHIPLAFAVILWWVLIFGLLAAAPAAAFFLFAMPFFVLWYRRESLKLGVYSLVSWNFNALATIQGFFRKRNAPENALRAKLIQPLRQTKP